MILNIAATIGTGFMALFTIHAGFDRANETPHLIVTGLVVVAVLWAIWS